MHGFNEFEANSVEATFQEGLDLLEADHCEEALQSFQWVIDHSPDHAEAHYYRGLTLLHLNRVRDALEAFKRAVALWPTEPMYVTHLGYALLAAGRPREALAELERALELQPDSVQAHLYHAAALAATDDLAGARRELETLIEQEPDNIDIRRHFAALLNKIGDEEGVLTQCRIILAQDPNQLDAIALAANVWLRRGDYASAVRYLRQQVLLDPANVRAWLNLLAAYEMLDRSDAVVAMASEALELGTEDPRLYLARARHLLAQHRLDDAITDLRAALALDERLFEAHLLLAQALGSTGKLRAALQHAARATHLRPNDRAALLLQADLHRLLGEIEAETRCLATLLAAAPRDFALLQRQVKNLLALKREDDVFATLDQFLSHEPHHQAAWLLYAEAAEQLANEGAAWRAYRRLLGLGRVSVAAYLAYAAFLVRRHRLEAAANVLDAATAHYPHEATLQACRAAVLQNLGRPAEACHHLETYLRSAPPSGEILWLLGRAYYMLGHYGRALDAFRRARELAGASERLAAPTFQCLLAEAYTLHHLGRTHEAIALLENNFGQYSHHQTDYFEALGELHEFAGHHAKALMLYGRGLESEPARASLHYRRARLLARLRSWRRALESLRQALDSDPSLAAHVRREKLFRPLWLLPAFHRLLGHERLLSAARRVLLAGAATAALVTAYELWSRLG